jgi:hypothetical protein
MRCNDAVMTKFKKTQYNYHIREVVETRVIMDGVSVSPFSGSGSSIGGTVRVSPRDRVLTRSVSSSFGNNKGSQTEWRSPISRVIRKKAETSAPVKKHFLGKGVSVDGTHTVEIKKRKTPKRQFTKKVSPKPPVAFTPFAGQGAPVVEALIRRGAGVVVEVPGGRRAVKKPVKFDPSPVPMKKVLSISRRDEDGLYTVAALMTEAEVVRAGGGALLRSFGKRRAAKK